MFSVFSDKAVVNDRDFARKLTPDDCNSHINNPLRTKNKIKRNASLSRKLRALPIERGKVGKWESDFPPHHEPVLSRGESDFVFCPFRTFSIFTFFSLYQTFDQYFGWFCYYLEYFPAFINIESIYIHLKKGFTTSINIGYTIRKSWSAFLIVLCGGICWAEWNLYLWMIKLVSSNFK